MIGQVPNRLTLSNSEAETELLTNALARKCSVCGAGTDVWCFRYGDGTWTMHGERIMQWGKRL